MLKIISEGIHDRICKVTFQLKEYDSDIYYKSVSEDSENVHISLYWAEQPGTSLLQPNDKGLYVLAVPFETNKLNITLQGHSLGETRIHE